MDPFYVTSHVRDDHMAAKKMDLPLHSTFVDSAPLVHTGNFGLESPSKQHSSLAESIDTVVSATTPTCNPINPLLESVPTVESVEQRSVLPQPIGEQPQDTQSPEGSPTLQPKRLHVSNIPFRYREHDLRTLFGVYSCVYLHCHCSAWRAKDMRVSLNPRENKFLLSNPKTRHTFRITNRITYRWYYSGTCGFYCMITPF